MRTRHIGLQVYATPGALREFELPFILGCLARHRRADWGDACEADKKANDEALAHGGRLLSVYTLGDLRLWIIEEADRSSTTALLPEDY